MFQDSVPAGSYNDPFLSRVTPMVAPTWCHRAFWGNLRCGVNVDRLEFRIDTFELVIRLSKVKQSAFRFFTIWWRPAAPAVPGIPVTCSFKWNCAEISETSVFAAPFAKTDVMPWHDEQAGTRLSGVVSFLLMVVWWGNTFCASNSLELVQLFMPSRHDLNTGLLWHNRTTHRFRNWVLFVNFLFWFFVCHQLVPHLVPNSPRVPLRNVSWGLGVCAVLGQVRFAV